MQVSSKKVITFAFLTLVFSSVFYILIISKGKLGLVTAHGLMWCPGLAAILTRLIYQKNLRGFGWSWGKTRYQLLSYVYPIFYASIAYGLVWLLRSGSFKAEFSSSLGSFLIKFILIGTAFNCFSALGEELGWRGFLTPELAKKWTFAQTSLIVGIVWAVWHYPLILFANYNSETPVFYGLICFTFGVIGTSFAYTWFRLKSGSVWTAMFLHASHNLYVQGLFDPLTDTSGITKFITGEFGAAFAIVGVITAFIFWRLRHKLPDV
ncbi:CPBP family intramembrane glutamic endopeptidase [Acidobacteriota bacterium]